MQWYFLNSCNRYYRSFTQFNQVTMRIISVSCELTDVPTNFFLVPATLGAILLNDDQFDAL